MATYRNLLTSLVLLMTETLAYVGSDANMKQKENVKLCLMRELAGLVGTTVQPYKSKSLDRDIECIAHCEIDPTCHGAYFIDSTCDMYRELSGTVFYDPINTGLGALIYCSTDNESVYQDIYGSNYLSSLSQNHYYKNQITNVNNRRTTVINNITIVVPPFRGHYHTNGRPITSWNQRIHDQGHTVGKRETYTGYDEWIKSRTAPSPTPRPPYIPNPLPPVYQHPYAVPREYSTLLDRYSARARMGPNSPVRAAQALRRMGYPPNHPMIQDLFY